MLILSSYSNGTSYSPAHHHGYYDRIHLTLAIMPHTQTFCSLKSDVQ
jgi:hypothetical protein